MQENSLSQHVFYSEVPLYNVKSAPFFVQRCPLFGGTSVIGIGTSSFVIYREVSFIWSVFYRWFHVHAYFYSISPPLSLSLSLSLSPPPLSLSLPLSLSPPLSLGRPQATGIRGGTCATGPTSTLNSSETKQHSMIQ